MRHRPPLDLSAARRRRRRVRPRPATPSGVREGRPGRHLGAELRRVGASSSTPRRSSARSWSTSTRPTAPTSCPTCCTRPASRCWSRAPEFKTSDYRAMVAEVRGDCPDLREVVFLGDDEWDALLETGRAADRGLLAERRRPSCPPTTRSTSSTPRGRPASRRARRSPTTTSSTTASSSARAAATPRPTGSASRCPSTTASAW